MQKGCFQLQENSVIKKFNLDFASDTNRNYDIKNTLHYFFKHPQKFLLITF